MIVGDRSAVRGLALACVVALSACAESAEEPGALRADAGLPDGHPPIAQETRLAVSADGPVGIVLETMHAGGYTYARVASLDEEIWVAGPQSPLSVGDSVSLAGAMGMTDFTSSVLGRTFESILFLNAFLSPAPSAAVAGTRGKVVETMNAAGYTYVHVDVEGEAIWIAGPPTAVSEGDTVAWIEGPVMYDFLSPSLGRTFDAIVFAGALSVVE